MKLQFRKGTVEDLELLVSSRMEVLAAVSDGYGRPLDPSTEEETRRYFREHLGSAYEAYFVYHEGQWVSCGGICFTTIIPTLENPTGRGAVIVNMYTKPDWRGKGIAYQLLDVLVQEAVARNISDISLEATPLGLALYKKYGFETNQEAMLLPYEKMREHREE